MIGSELDGKYKIEAELGSGGAGTVYRGLNTLLGTGVAIKVIHPSLSQSVELRQRFEREARALAALSHPNIVSIVDSGVTADIAYLVMDLLEGETLAGRLKRGPLSLEVAAPLLYELLGALAYVHAQGLVHRDVKPANVFLESLPGGVPPRVRLLDFGLAKFLAPEAGDPALTRAGQVFGTPSYMAPEQIAGQPADARADLYAAGIVFFEMLAGAPPFRGDSSEVLRQHVMEDLPIVALPSEAATPEIVALLLRATAKTRAERFASATEMQAALEAAAAQSPGVLGMTDTTLDAPGLSATDARGSRASWSGSRPGSRPGSEGGIPEQSFGSRLFRLTASIGVVVSLSALGVAAFAAYVFVTPGHDQERRTLEVALRLPPPKHAAVSLSAAHALADPVPPSASGSPGSTGPSAPAEAARPAPPLGSTAPLAPPAAPVSSAALALRPHEPVPNPWASVPRELARLLGKSNHGGGIDKREIASVHQYNAKHPTDPRGHLLLARGYLNRHWFKDAVGEYAIALEVNQDARGDPRMLPDLVRLVEFGSNDAAKMIMDIYPDTAASAIDRALLSPPNPEAKSRLEHVKADLPRPNPRGP
jgi:serine/threonine protein kinase